jgi:hypothetical protein
MAGFPTREEFLSGQVPDGYPLVCPFCNQEVPGCYFLSSDGGYVIGIDCGSLPVVVSPNKIFVLQETIEHPLVVVPQVLHEC